MQRKRRLLGNADNHTKPKTFELKTAGSPKKQRTKKKLIREEKEEKDKSKKPKLPEKAFTTRRHGDATFRGILTTHESRNVGNVGPREFGATVPDIGPKRPKSLRCTH
ncbi:hypothetical protein PIB30_072437 [Stylosanthes scabra]|uniref:Uncharacterized protein n=1 Tax=Stylosanthes scabra TaxID=79078 RepID=A0ABU6QP59_9FABA|nr:hypothetical protein [Stylosanthes scabra]